MKPSRFERDVTGAIKGIALILMFVHHFFTFPSWLVDGIDYPWIQAFADAYCSPTDLCVGIFAFLTGYFYAYAKKRSYGYSLRKITDVLVSYWIIYLPLLLIAAAMGCYTFSVSGVVFEAFGLLSSVMSFCWYIYFYCIVMLLLPLLTRGDGNSPAADILRLLVLPVAVLSVLVRMELPGMLYSVVYNVRLWLPCVSSGYLFAKYAVFQRVFDPYLARLRSKGAKVLALLLMCWLAFRGRYFLQGVHLGSLEIRGGQYDLLFTMDILYAPLFVYGAAGLLERIRDSAAFRVLLQIGKHSMLMWFVHCVFFNVCKETTQRILYFPKNPILVTLNGLLLCYLAAALVNPLLTRLLKWKNTLPQAALKKIKT